MHSRLGVSGHEAAPARSSAMSKLDIDEEGFNNLEVRVVQKMVYAIASRESYEPPRSLTPGQIKRLWAISYKQARLPGEFKGGNARPDTYANDLKKQRQATGPELCASINRQLMNEKARRAEFTPRHVIRRHTRTDERS